MTLYAQTSPLWSLIFAGRCRDGTATLNELSSTLSDLMSQFRVFQSSHCWPHASRLRCCGAVVAAILALRSSSGFVFLHSFMLCSSSHWERWLSARRRRYVAAATPLYRSSPQLASAFKASCRPNGRRRCFYDFHVVAAPRCSRESVLDSDLSASAT